MWPLKKHISIGFLMASCLMGFCAPGFADSILSCSSLFDNSPPHYTQNGSLIAELVLKLIRENQNGISNNRRILLTKKISDLLVTEMASQGWHASAFLNQSTKVDANGKHDPVDDNWMVGIDGVSEKNLQRHGPNTLMSAGQKFSYAYFLAPSLKLKNPASMSVTPDGQKLIILPIESVLSGRIGEDLSTLHELAHAKLNDDLEKGNRRPYYGQVQSTGPEAVTHLPGYEKFWNFQELFTVHRQMRQAESGAYAEMALGYEHIQYSEKNLAESLKDMSGVALQLITGARSAIAAKQVNFVFDPTYRKIRAEVFRYTNDNPIPMGQLKFWLVDSQLSDDNEHHLEEFGKYLDEMEEAARFHLLSAQAVIDKYEKSSLNK
jgi:hypothetical protein